VRSKEVEDREFKVEGKRLEGTLAPSVTGSTASPKILIIGGGMAGLACGSYLQMNGYRTEILEASAVPGGLCSAWNRGPYIFDGCLRWLVGTQPSSAFYRIWQELGAIAGRKIVNHDEVVRIEGADGRVLSVPADLDKLGHEFKRVAPEDAALIDQLLRAAKCCAPLEPPLEKPLELMTIFEKMKLGFAYLPMLPVIGHWKNLLITAYLKKYRNPFLREALLALAGDERVSALVLVMLLAFRSRLNTGFVVGGSQAFIRAIADRYARLGGMVRPHAQVVSVTVEQGRATGVRCADGTIAQGSTVVSCADGHATIFKMLDGRFVNKRILYVYRTCDLFPALIQISLGIGKTFMDAPHCLNLPLPQPLVVDNQTQHHRMEVTVFASDSALCPEGKTIMIVRLSSRCDYWMNLRHHRPDGYKMEKETILQKIICILDHRFPGLAQRVEFSDVATPATFVRHTGNWQGSYEGWLPTPRILGRRIPRTLPGLEDFYMAGQWVEPGGGLPSAALSGRYVAQMICARDGRAFTTTEP
jgi:phytoene dehydrogenase-like protein